MDIEVEVRRCFGETRRDAPRKSAPSPRSIPLYTNNYCQPLSPLVPNSYRTLLRYQADSSLESAKSTFNFFLDRQWDFSVMHAKGLLVRWKMCGDLLSFMHLLAAARSVAVL
jgi:hypothetical protein